MNIYIWESLDMVSTNYHEDGGLIIVAESLADAKEQANLHNQKESWSRIKIDKDPDFVYPLADLGENKIDKRVIVFPDAGCC